MSKVTMPEPVAYFYQRDFDKYKDRYTGGIPVITIDQADAYAAAKVREALEEAAALCDRFAERDMHPEECAGAIRLLITKEKT